MPPFFIVNNFREGVYLANIVGRCLLRELLHRADMDQVDLANKMNVTPQQINKYVKNTQGMSLEVARNISLILKCNIEDLYEWIEVGDNE